MTFRLTDISVAFGDRRVVDGASLAIEPGERVGLIGASGSGKSMLALAALDLLPPKARRGGEVSLHGRSLATRNAARAARGRRIGLVFQEPMSALNPLMTARAQVSEALAVGRLASETARARNAEADALLARLGLDGLGRRHPHQLSGGQRQRVVLALALANEPDVLIADEPTTALDLVTQRETLDLILAESERIGSALLMVSHDLNVIRHCCSRVLVMDAGRIVERCSTNAIETAGHPATRRLLKAFDARARPRAPAAPTRALAELTGVSKIYRSRSSVRRGTTQTAVDQVDLRLRQGETLALMGESGAGKSTLARLVLGLDAPSRGAVNVLHGTGLGAVFQDPYDSLDPRWTVGRSIAEPLLATDASRPERERRVGAALREVGLEPGVASRPPVAFSGGQRQRIAIARALVTRPRLVVLDEPVTALDAHVRGDVLGLLNRLAAEHGITYLVVSHDVATVAALSDRLAVMERGRIVELGDTASVLSAPSHSATQRLLNARL